MYLNRAIFSSGVSYLDKNFCCTLRVSRLFIVVFGNFASLKRHLYVCVCARVSLRVVPKIATFLCFGIAQTCLIVFCMDYIIIFCSSCCYTAQQTFLLLLLSVVFANQRYFHLFNICSSGIQNIFIRLAGGVGYLYIVVTLHLGDFFFAFFLHICNILINCACVHCICDGK